MGFISRVCLCVLDYGHTAVEVVLSEGEDKIIEVEEFVVEGVVCVLVLGLFV